MMMGMACTWEWEARHGDGGKCGGLPMRRFHLVRKEDLSGVSGTGVVAEGIEFDNGSVAMCWLTKYHIIETAPNVHTIEAVHGHGGRTYVEFLDPLAS